MNWLDKLLPPKIKRDESDVKKTGIPEGLWVKCPACQSTLYSTDLNDNHKVCPKCQHHMPLTAKERFELLMDEDPAPVRIAESVQPIDILKFKDSKRYVDRLAAARKKSDETEAVVVARGKINGFSAVLAVFDFNFIGGSMGSVVGERFVQGVEEAITLHCPFICVSASGGARMQEGLNSLMQMAKTSAVLHKLAENKLPFISILTDPTMGGVSASFAFLGDVVIAEPGALIGFAGPRVIEQTVRETLPEGFQRSEFLLEKGAIDLIITRQELKKKLTLLIDKLMYPNKSRIKYEGKTPTFFEDAADKAKRAAKAKKEAEAKPKAEEANVKDVEESKEDESQESDKD